MSFDVTEPVDFDTAIQKLDSKGVLPLTLKSEEIQRRISADLRDRSFFSAQVANAELLQGFKDGVNKIVSGKSDLASQRLELKKVLKKFEYRPTLDKAGTIEDLSSDARLNLILNTNTAMVQGYGQWQEGNDPDVLIAFPAQELIRHARRKVPRHWRTIWDVTRLQLGSATTATPAASGRLIAMKNDPIWAKISDFGLPWPPFKFNSGMGVDDVSFDECLDLGLIKEKETPAKVVAAIAKPPLALNSNLRASAKGLDPDFIGVLTSTLLGISLVGEELVAGGLSDSDTVENRSAGEVMFLLMNSGTSGGAFKGWETRRAGMRAAIDSVVSGRSHEVEYGDVSGSESAMIKRATGLDVRGYKHVMDRNFLVHVDRRHGPGAALQIGEPPVTKADMAKLPDIVAHPDKVLDGGVTARGIPCVKYVKKIGHVHYFVEEIWTSEKQLVAKTFYKKNAVLGNRATPEGGVDHTSETSRTARSKGTMRSAEEVFKLLSRN